MINKIFLLGLLFVFATSCEYNENNFDGLDEEVSPTDIKTIDYTLTDADYSTIASNSTNKTLATTNGVLNELTALKTTMTFSSTLSAADYVPAFLASKYYSADNGSAIEVTYNQGVTNDLSAYEDSIYSLGTTDYEAVNTTVGLAQTFTSTYTPSTYLPSLIAAKYPNAESGDICLAYYNYTDEEPVEGQSTVFSESFDSGAGAFQLISISGTKVWYASSASSDFYMKISGFGEATPGTNEDWLVSPQIDLTTKIDPVLTVSQAAKYLYSNWDQITVNISTDYNGSDVTTATWTPLTISTLPTGSDYTITKSEQIDLSAYEGQKIYVAFKYLSTSSNAATWLVSNVEVLSKGLSASGVSQMGTYYKYSGTKWAPITDTYALSSDDYSDMGFTSNYFNSTNLPDNYLPQFLTLKYPYAQEDDEMIVGYKYYSSGTLSYLADSYSFVSGTWTKANETEIVTDQFVKANGVWRYNPSVVITLLPSSGNTVSTAFYQAATDWVWANIDQAILGVTTKGLGYVSSYGNNEYYSGCSAYYNNVDLRASKAKTQYAAGYQGLTDDEITNLMKEHLKEVFGKTLSSLYPDAATIDGVDITYTINTALYTGTSVYACTHSYVYKLVGTGEFEYVSGPTAIE